MTPSTNQETSNTALTDFNTTPDNNTDNADTASVKEKVETPSFDGSEITDTDDVFEAVENFIDDILEAAESDEAGAIVQEYIDQAATIALTRYSTRNQISLIMQLQHRGVDYQHDAIHFAGFNTWLHEHNRHVKEGEKGYKVVAPQTGLTCPECGNAPAYHKNNNWLDCPRAGTNPQQWDVDPDTEWSTGILYFKTTTTFAYPQTKPKEDADPDDVFTKSDVENHAVADNANITELFSRFKKAVKNNGYTLEIRDPNVLEHGKKGSSAGGEIFVKQRDNTADQFRTLAHEYAHEILHQTENGPVDLPDGVIETEAEAIAYAVCSYFNIDATNSQFYIRSWVEHATENGTNTADDNDKQPTIHDLIKDRLDTVQSTATKIINTIEDTEIESQEE